MPCDGAEMARVRARLHDLADLRDHVPKFVVGGVVVRPDPDSGARPEVAEDLTLRELLVHGRELVDMDGDGKADIVEQTTVRVYDLDGDGAPDVIESTTIIGIDEDGDGVIDESEITIERTTAVRSELVPNQDVEEEDQTS